NKSVYLAAPGAPIFVATSIELPSLPIAAAGNRTLNSSMVSTDATIPEKGSNTELVRCSCLPRTLGVHHRDDTIPFLIPMINIIPFSICDTATHCPTTSQTRYTNPNALGSGREDRR